MVHSGNRRLDICRDLRGHCLRPVRRHFRGPDLHRGLSCAVSDQRSGEFEPRKPHRRRRTTSRRRRARCARASTCAGTSCSRADSCTPASDGARSEPASSIPRCPDTFIEGGFRQFGGNTDDEIIVDFARALAVDPNAASMVGPVQRRYMTGFSGFLRSCSPLGHVRACGGRVRLRAALHSGSDMSRSPLSPPAFTEASSSSSIPRTIRPPVSPTLARSRISTGSSSLPGHRTSPIHWT